MKTPAEVNLETLLHRIESRRAVVGVVGLGYVGLPLAVAIAKAGFRVIGFDIDAAKIRKITWGKPYIDGVSEFELRMLRERKQIRATDDFSKIGEVDIVIIAVPTPLKHGSTQKPDLSFVRETAFSVSNNLGKGQLVVLESTTYPGTTRELVCPILERPDTVTEPRVLGRDFFLAYSPEREDPGNKEFSFSKTPKVVGGMTEACLRAAREFYQAVVPQVAEVSCPEAAEAAKLLENIYRCVNIALVNELKLCFEKMGIDIWEVIGAAATKPFGFQPFWPGPGLGGHCIPIDPFYLAWKARKFGFETKFIELAGQINRAMPLKVVQKTQAALHQRGISISDAKVMIYGLAYKADVDDDRESPAFEIMRLLSSRVASLSYYDPHITKMPEKREFDLSVPFEQPTKKGLSEKDAVIIVTDHSAANYEMLGIWAPLIIDTRNAMGGIYRTGTVIKA